MEINEKIAQLILDVISFELIKIKPNLDPFSVIELSRMHFLDFCKAYNIEKIGLEKNSQKLLDNLLNP